MSFQFFFLQLTRLFLFARGFDRVHCEHGERARTAAGDRGRAREHRGWQLFGAAGDYHCATGLRLSRELRQHVHFLQRGGREQ